VARRTGKTQTGAIEEALELLLATLARNDDEEARVRTERILEVARQFDSLLTDEDRELLTTDWLYDEETGLPK
jgi:hypothetical protein